MGSKQIAAGIVAAAVLAGSIGIAFVNGEKPKTQEEGKMQTEQVQPETYNYEYGIVQSLYFKINELWRLSINSDLSSETINAIAALNNGFDGEILMKAIQAAGEGVIDEYIYSVIAGLNFELYSEDIAAYEGEKAGTAYAGEVLTLEKIDEYLNLLNREKANNEVNKALDNTPEVNIPTPNTDTKEVDVPDIPNAQSVLPKNPGEAVKRETEAITNRAMRIGVE